MKSFGMKIRILLFLTILLIAAAAIIFSVSLLFHKEYYGSDFGIENYISPFDTDGDGIDDQTDILESAKTYISTKPEYKSKYYAGGYPDDEYGVCTDVVAFALKNAGYDLRELVEFDIISNPEEYDIEIRDKNIDFRRVKNLNVYFKNIAASLTVDLSDIGDWQGGDIVVFKNHIGIVSDKRNRKGIPFLIHHSGTMQLKYEEDVLESYEIVSHYRVG